ncbi:gluconate 2-dehydrogenase subunit 3 family protein [Brevibacillus humidisoli]|uniref:gluconate 2-dehydrogenase subunit 3 family protein n=1 Tax=Brevibacillus humidisoli TaxID=2895522 RepID=UPI001E55587B|nr:gluconate 2-dehydrogenase subunit 3 family protein [Brevibacillus humidisoli]UFJ40936.1 gluconate 2-dehydrogenase subunit 3 family protein [Brevibacillus humidisoli]
MSESSYYPWYNVWDEHEHWDPHTRQIVAKRRTPVVSHSFLTRDEALLIQTLAGVLTDEYRQEVLTFVTQHIDESLRSPVGESQRKAGVPEKKTLYRVGMGGLNELSHRMYRTDFIGLKRDQQEELLSLLESGRAPQTPAWMQVQPKDFFKKVLFDVVSAYYSHPLVWSDIGYGGPAYPRGYVRVEKGLVDPWEAKRDGK